jgi:hypothetical protein
MNDIMEYLIKCPFCYSETKIVMETITPVVYTCKGCNRCVIILGNVIYTVSYEFAKKLFKKYGYRQCGKLVDMKVSSIAETLTEVERVQQLKKLLDQKMDVADFIKKLG